MHPPLAETGIHLDWYTGSYTCQDLSVWRSGVWECTHKAYVGCSRDQNATHMAVANLNHRRSFKAPLYQWQMHQQGLSSARGVIGRRETAAPLILLPAARSLLDVDLQSRQVVGPNVGR